MRAASRLARALVTAGLLVAALACGQRDEPLTRADDTAVNARDRGNTVTPLDQSESAADRETTQRLRQALVGDASLSTNAKNVKIVTSGGTVTLRGPVESEAERATILAKARELAGSHRIDNQLEVQSNH